MPEPRSLEELLPLSPVSLAILVAIADGPKHGYAIAKQMEEETRGRIVPSAGTLYAALERLLDQKLLEETQSKEPDDDARRRYYGLTSLGRKAARAEIERLRQTIALAAAKRLVPTP